MVDRGFENVSKSDFGLTKVDQWHMKRLKLIVEKYLYFYKKRKSEDNFH